MADQLRIGIVGTGFIAAVHARSARLAGGELVGVASATPELAAAGRDAFGATRAYASADALIDDALIDVVHICTPNHLHVPLTREAMAAGKHVVCEKPLAVTATDAHAVCDEARAAGVQTAVPYVYRYYPTVREARERVATGATGRIRLLHGSYLQDWLLRESDDNWRVDAELGGASRAFADIGSHWCDLAEFVSGERISRLSARMITALPERLRIEGLEAFAAADANGDGVLRSVTTEDIALVQFETGGGAFGSLVVSQVAPGRKNRLWIELDGSEAALAFDQEQPESLWYGRRERLEIVRRDPSALSAAAAPFALLPAGHPQGYADCFNALVADFYDSVRSGTAAEGMPQFSDGARAADLTEAVIASAAALEWVDVPVHAFQEVTT